MDRSQWYTGGIARSYDLLKGDRRAAIGLGFGFTDTIGGVQDSAAFLDAQGKLGDNLQIFITDHAGITASSPLFGQPNAVVNGFEIQRNNPTALHVLVGPGSVYASMQADLVQATAAQWIAAQGSGAAAVAGYSALSTVGAGALTGYGDIAADATAAAVQFIVPAAALLTVKPGSGSNFYLIEVVPVQVDQTASDDPNASSSTPFNAVLPYYNSASPSTPLQGPGGTNPPTQQPSGRMPTGLVQFCANSPQTTANALTLDTGAIPLYVIQVESTDSVISGSRTWAAGLGTAPTVSSAGVAPFLRGLIQQHHLGVLGSAPKIDGGVEWAPQSTVFNDTLGTGSGTFQQFQALSVVCTENPTKTTAEKNHLSAKNICKAWGLVTTDGAGGATLVDGFSVASVAISSTNINVTLATAMASSNYCVISNSGANAAYITPVISSTTVFALTGELPGATGVNFSISAQTVFFAVYGQQ